MSINLKDILALQQEVKEQIVNGAPGRRGGSGCCAAAPVKERAFRVPGTNQFKPNVVKKIKGIHDRAEVVENLFVRPPMQPRPNVHWRTNEEAHVPGDTMRYSFRALKKLVMADLVERGINPEEVDISFDQLGCLCRAK